MEEPTELLLRIYERTIEQLRDFDARIAEQIHNLISPEATPNVRDLAFLEGLRSERDQVLEAMKDSEATLFNHLLGRAGAR